MTKRLFMALLSLAATAAFGADKMVVGYYPSWMSGVFPHTAIPWQYLTHIAHAFIGPQANGSLDVPSGFLYPNLVKAAHANGVKVVVSVGGWNTTYDNNFTTIAADSNSRRTFASNLKQFCVTNGYDGADIDWEFPESATDRTNHALMIHAIRQAFDSVIPRLTLSMAGPATDWGGQWFDFAATGNDFDWIGIMSYDFYGNWTSVAGPNAGLSGTNPPNDQGWVDYSVIYYNSTRGVPKAKLLIGVPFYGWTFNAAALYGTATGSPKAVQEIYSTIAARLAQGWTRTWDASGQVPYMQDAARTKLTSYDDSASVALKAAYVTSKDVGGVILWALGQDLINGSPVLLESIGKLLRPVTGVEEVHAVPSDFGLEQNWPNPFNPLTTIHYTVAGVRSQGPGTSNTSLVVYDLLGRQVGTLVDEVKAPGSYEVHFDGTGLASGVYFYRLQSGEFSQTKKFVLLR